jgi:hypothetical protein
MATDTAVASVVDSIRELASLGKTDARIAMLLGLHLDKVKRLRRKHGIQAGFYLDKATGSTPRNTHVRVTPLPQPLSPDEVGKLRQLERDGVDGKPAKRGRCEDCDEWLLLDGGRLPMHQARRVGIDRRFAPRCDRSLTAPAWIEGER